MNPQLNMSFPDSLTPEEQLSAAKKLQEQLEKDFLELGYILNEIKTRKRYTLRGYLNFKDYCQKEIGLKPSVANRLIRVYDTYIVKLQMSEFDVQQIGLDKLDLVLPLVKESDALEQERWIDEARNNDLNSLKESVNEAKAEKKEKKKTLKELTTDQFIDNFTSLLNVSKKGLMFCLALYFSDKDNQKVHDEVIKKTNKFQDNPEEFYAKEND